MDRALRVNCLGFMLTFLIASVILVAPLSALSQGNWTEKTPMPTARYGLKVAVVEGKIYAIGGYDSLASLAGPTNPYNYTYAGINEEYNPTTDTWTNKSAMPKPLQTLGIAVYQNKIYCFSGATTEVYSPADDTWETKASMPHPRIHVAASLFNDKIYVMGGRTGGPDTTVALNEVYDPATDKWTTKASMPYPVIQSASAVVGNKIYVMGGQNEYKVNGTMTMSTNQIYDTETDTWSLGASLPTAVWMASAGVVESKICVVGGQLDMMMDGTNMVQIYNPANNNWSNGTSMPCARFGLAIAVLNDKLYAIGGTDGYLFPGEKAMANNEIYSPLGYEPEYSTTESKTQDALPMELLIIVISLVIISVILLALAKARRANSTSKPFSGLNQI